MANELWDSSNTRESIVTQRTSSLDRDELFRNLGEILEREGDFFANDENTFKLTDLREADDTIVVDFRDNPHDGWTEVRFEVHRNGDEYWIPVAHIGPVEVRGVDLDHNQIVFTAAAKAREANQALFEQALDEIRAKAIREEMAEADAEQDALEQELNELSLEYEETLGNSQRKYIRRQVGWEVSRLSNEDIQNLRQL